MRALDGLTLGVQQGEMVALLGPSGCGKTTALKIIAGLDAPTGGDVHIAGRSVLGQSPQARGAVMVFQNQLLFPHMTVAQNIGFGLRMQGLPSTAAVHEMLERVQLTGLGGRKPAQLSGGQAQRAALARALILKPKVLLLDEPLSSLDANLRAEMRDLICTIQADLGLTTILVTHDQTEAVQMAGRIALMSHGKLLQYARPQDFYARPANIEVARFFGGVNFIAGMGTDGAVQTALGPMGAANMRANLGAGVVTIRPERVALGRGNFVGRIAHKSYLGTYCAVKLIVGDSVISAHVGPDFPADVGTEIAVDLPQDALWFMPGAGE
jgi:ABC-type Fe3+/spermidine/putrescine transport system ATPase subunit